MIPQNTPIPKLSVSPITSHVSTRFTEHFLVSLLWIFINSSSIFSNHFEIFLALQIKLSDVMQYFENFGEIECYYLRRDHYDSIIIQFKNVNVDLILRRRYHLIRKYIMTVELASEQITDLKNIITKKVLLIDLNNALLAKISDHLYIDDLCSVANTCTRFEKIAMEIFSSKFNKIKWCAGDTNAMNVFKQFGHLITSLDVDVTEPQNDLLEFIAETCNYNLLHLSLWMQYDDTIRLTERTKMKLKLLFSQLNRLDFYCQQLFDLETTMELFASCLELKSLTLNCMTETNYELNRIIVQFPKLEELMFHLNQSINDNGFEHLLAFNPNIKKLYLDECTNLSASAVEIIVRYLPNLEELSLGFLLQKVNTQELRLLGELKHLKSLNIILGPALPLINVIYESGIQIECLMLWYVAANDVLIERLSNMKSLKNLTISGNEHVINFIKDDHLELLAMNLPDLNVIRLGYSDQITIDGLKHFLLNAKNLTHLALTNIKNVTTANKCDLLNCVAQRPNLTIDIE